MTIKPDNKADNRKQAFYCQPIDKSCNLNILSFSLHFLSAHFAHDNQSKQLCHTGKTVVPT